LFWGLRSGSVPSPPLRPQNKIAISRSEQNLQKGCYTNICSLDFLRADNRDGLFGLTREALGRALAQRLVPTIEYSRVEPANASDRVFQVLGAPDPATAGNFSHPAQGMFLPDTLLQTVSQGLYGRPCISAVLALDQTMKSLGARSIESDTRITVVCSCIGGTGGGLGVPVLAFLQTLCRKDVSLRLVLLGRYFEATQDAIAAEYERFESNKVLFVRALKEFVPQLHSFCYIEEPRMIGRIRGEDKADRLPWPESTDLPYWRAVCGLHHLLEETKREARGEFEAREVPAKDFESSIDLNTARTRLERALARIDSSLSHAMLRRIASEAAPSSVWGDKLEAFLRSYWRVTRDAAKGDARVLPALGRSIQSAAERLWDGGTGDYAVRTLFPNLPSPGPASPVEIQRIGWPKLDPPPPIPEFQNPERAAKLIAAAFLFSCLQGE
jgi:hypothetical protein